ncbi:MAG: family 16 glycoside hydrolase [Limisphaerales bacterium]
MTTRLAFVPFALAAAFLLPIRMAAAAAGANPEEGFRPLFDGRTLEGWSTPEPAWWTVEDGAITGRISPERPCSTNQYLIWRGGELADFELKLRSRLNGEGGINNGFQFRSRLLPDHDVCGYQVDNNLQTPWLVRLYDEYGRHTLAWRGEQAVFDPEGRRTATRFDPEAEPAWFRLEDWHEYHLVCVGGRISLKVDGRLAAEVEDQDERRAEPQGILALQLHSGPPTVVQFKDVRLKVLKPAASSEPRPGATIVESRNALARSAVAWWDLDTGGHGARPPLRHFPGWDQFELNVRPAGTGSRPEAKVILLHGAHLEAGHDLHGGPEQITVYLRARDPAGTWNAALFSKRDGPDRVHFNLFSADLPGTPGTDIGFELHTGQGFVQVSFPTSRIDRRAWHDLVGRYDGRTVDLYCDGQLLTSKPWGGALITNREPLLIGGEMDQGKVGRHFHGELETAALWDRGLSDEEIRSLSGKPDGGGSATP